MNKTLKMLLFSDIFVTTGFGLFEPILAIFIKENLVGGTIFAAGVASTLFLVTKCLVQLPFARYVDKHDDKVKWLLVGMLLISTVPFIYVFAHTIAYIYLAQIIYGLGAALAYPTWLGLWSINLEKHKESFQWSLYSTLTGLGTAATAAIGGAISEFVGFRVTFIMVGIMSLLGCSVLLLLERKKEKDDFLKRTEKTYHKRRKLVYQKYH